MEKAAPMQVPHSKTDRGRWIGRLWNCRRRLRRHHHRQIGNSDIHVKRRGARNPPIVSAQDRAPSSATATDASSCLDGMRASLDSCAEEYPGIAVRTRPPLLAVLGEKTEDKPAVLLESDVLANRSDCRHAIAQRFERFAEGLFLVVSDDEMPFPASLTELPGGWGLGNGLSDG